MKNKISTLILSLLLAQSLSAAGVADLPELDGSRHSMGLSPMDLSPDKDSRKRKEDDAAKQSGTKRQKTEKSSTTLTLGTLPQVHVNQIFSYLFENKEELRGFAFLCKSFCAAAKNPKNFYWTKKVDIRDFLTFSNAFFASAYTKLKIYEDDPEFVEDLTDAHRQEMNAKLSQLTRVQSLEIMQDQVLEHFTRFPPQLRDLTLVGVRLSNLSNLPATLTTLSFDQECEVGNWDGLAGIPLVNLEISEMNLTVVPPLPGSLENLSIRETPIQQAANISVLPRLRRLELVQTQLPSLAGVSPVTRELRLNNNPGIQNYDGLISLPLLQRLNMDANGLTAIPPVLLTLPVLEFLSLERNSFHVDTALALLEGTQKPLQRVNVGIRPLAFSFRRDRDNNQWVYLPHEAIR